MKKENDFQPLRNKAEIDAFWEEHKDDEDVKLLTESLSESLKVFYLTDEEIKEMIKQIVCSRDVETAQKLTYAIESLAINEMEDFATTKGAEAVSKRKKFAKDALSALLDVHLTGCGEIRDRFFQVVDSAKTDFNINSMALAKKTLFSQASQSKYQRAVEAIFQNEKWENLGIKFTKEEFKNMVEKCTTILCSVRKEVVNEVLELLSQFSKDDEGHFVLDIKSLVKNCTSLLVSSPKKLQETIDFLNENYPRADILENVRASASILMVNPENVFNYEAYLSICLEELGENYVELAQNDFVADAKKNCSLSNLNMIDKMNKNKLENMHRITEVLIKNKIDSKTAYYAVKNLTITGQIKAEDLDAFLCFCIANEDKGGRDLMNQFFNTPSLAIEAQDAENGLSNSSTDRRRLSREDENVNASCGMTSEEARKKLQEMGKSFEGHGEKIFNLVTEKVKNRKKRTKTQTDPPADGETHPNSEEHKKKEPVKQEPAHTKTEHGIVIPDFSDCADDLPLAEMANRIVKFREANGFEVSRNTRKCLNLLKPAYQKMREIDRQTNFKPLEEFCSLSGQIQLMLNQNPKMYNSEQTRNDAENLYKRYLNSFRECQKETERVSRQIIMLPEFKVIRDDLKKTFGKYLFVETNGCKVKRHYHNTFLLHRYLTFAVDVTEKFLENAGLDDKQAEELVRTYLTPDNLIHEHLKSPYADNNLAIFRVAMNRSLLGVITTTNEIVDDLKGRRGKNVLNVIQIVENNDAWKDKIKNDNMRIQYLNDVLIAGEEFFDDDEVAKFVSEMGFKNYYEFFVHTDNMVYSGEFTNGKVDTENVDNIYLGVPKTIDDSTLQKIGCTRLIGSPTGNHNNDRTK